MTLKTSLLSYFRFAIINNNMAEAQTCGVGTKLESPNSVSWNDVCLQILEKYLKNHWGKIIP